MISPRTSGFDSVEIREKTAFFEAQVNSTIDAILVVDANGRTILQNQRMVDLFNIPREIVEEKEDAKRRDWVMNLVTNPGPFLEKVMYLYAHRSEVSRDELELKDGRFLDRYSSPVIGKDGEYYGRIWTFRDITEQKQSEKALRETEASLKLFRALIDRSSDCIEVVDPMTARYLDINESGLRSLGYTLEEMQEMTVFDVNIGLDQAMFEAVNQKSKETGCATAEFWQRRKDGSSYLAEVNVSMVTMGRDYAVAVVRDITKRKEAEAQVLLQSAALEAAANGIVITDGKGTIQWTNQAFSALTGYSLGEVIGGKPSVLKSGKQDDAFYKKLWTTINAGNVWKEEIVNRRKDGMLYTEEMTITPMRGPGGEITHFIAVKQEITKRKLLEGKLVELSRQAGMAEVATGVLHNIGNVLNSLNISANLLLDQIRATPVADLERIVALMRDQGENLGEFFARDERGPKVLNFLGSLAEMLKELQDSKLKEVFSLQRNTDHIKEVVAKQQNYARLAGLIERVIVADLVEDATAMSAAIFQRDGVRLERQFAAGVPAITTEKNKVLQILVNLLSNARAACNESERPDKQITVRVTHSEERVWIQVIDNGAGIRLENLNRIFNHGFTTKKEGHGFGLHNSANAAMEIGGSLSASSDGPGHGATFVLELPVNYRHSDPLAGEAQSL